MKKLFKALLVICCLFTQVVPVIAESNSAITFTDTNSDTPHNEDIVWLADNSISTGFNDGTFRPYDNVARCDMAAFLRRLAVLKGIDDASTWTAVDSDYEVFVDVDRDTPHADDILWLAHSGISEGWIETNGTKTFRPYDLIARCDMAAFITRLAKKMSNKDAAIWQATDTDFNAFKDVNSGTPHVQEVLWLAHDGISTGWSDGTFRPEQKIARCDMAAFLHRLAIDDLAEKVEAAKKEYEKAQASRISADNDVANAENSVQQANALLEEAKKSASNYDALLQAATEELESAKKVVEEAESALSEAKVYNKIIYGATSEMPFLTDDIQSSYSLKPEEAGDKKVTYYVYSSKNSTNSQVYDTYAKQIRNTGTVTPYTYTTYWGYAGNGIYTGTTKKPDDMSKVAYTTEDVETGTYYVVAKWDGGQAEYNIVIEDYSDTYISTKVSEQNQKNFDACITNDMTDEEKVKAITKYVAQNYKYDVSYQSTYDLYTTGGGDCWASTNAIVSMAKQLGFKAWSHDARYQFGAGSGHYNALVKIGDGYYICEAGYSQYYKDGTRPYSFYKVDSYQISSNGSTGVVELERVNDVETDVIDVPSNVTVIGEITSSNGTFSALGGAKSATKINISASVTEITESNMKIYDFETTVDENNQYFKSVDGGLLSKDGKTLYSGNKQASSYTVPSTVETIEPYAFCGYYTRNTRQVTLNEGLKTIKTYGFLWTYAKKMIFPSTLETIEEKAFNSSSVKTFVFKGKNTVIADGIITKYSTVYGYKGSTAETAANAVGATFVEITDANKEEAFTEDMNQLTVNTNTSKPIVNVTDEERAENIKKAENELSAAKAAQVSAQNNYDSIYVNSVENRQAELDSANQALTVAKQNREAAVAAESKAKAKYEELLEKLNSQS